MTTTTPISSGPRDASATTVTVLCAVAKLSAEGLRAALYGRSVGVDVTWDVSTPASLLAGLSPAIALCDAASVDATTSQWPGCAVVAVVPAHDDGTAVIAALQAGAATCVRGDNLAIAAAFILAVARRGGLILEGEDR